jgi:pimeloyl-ACP methyl ester carboxylesterase
MTIKQRGYGPSFRRISTWHLLRALLAQLGIIALAIVVMVMLFSMNP